MDRTPINPAIVMHHSRSICIRPLSADDFDDVRAVETASQRYPWSDALIREELLAPHGTHFAVTSDAGGLRSCILCRLYADEFHIHNICTLPQERRQGLATALIRHGLSFASSRGARRAFLEVRASNDAAVRLYSSLTFVPIMTRNNYYSNSDDALVMSRLL